MIQDANQHGKPLQLISYDLFDRTSYKIIEDALRKFAFPEITIQAIKRLALFGWAKVQVNGKTGILFIIKTGSGQGDPISSILFLISSTKCVYHVQNNQQSYVQGFFFADDNLAGLNIRSL